MNEQSFMELLVPLLQPAYRLAGAMLHDAEAAKDVVQDASLIAWRKLPRLEDRTHVRGWFLGIVANQCRNARRTRWFSGVRLGLPSGLSVLSGEDRMISRADLRKAMRRLSYEDQLVVTLYFYLDLPLVEVATIAGLSFEAAKSRLYRAVHQLRPEVAIEEALR